MVVAENDGGNGVLECVSGGGSGSGEKVVAELKFFSFLRDQRTSV